MRKLLPLLFLFLFAGNVAAQEYQDWKWLHETPQGNTLRWVKMWDANNWYAIGFSGTFMKTTNGGASWWFHHKAGLPRTDGSTSYLYDAHFFDQNTGVVVGTAGAMRTTNGGVSFDTTSGIPSAATCYQVYFLNDQVGYVAGTTSVRIARTSDGGLTWTPNTIIATGTFYDVWSPNDTLLVVASTSGNVRRSTDAGLTWATILTGATATLYKLQFSDALNGWVAGSSSSARYTTDAGLTWTSANTGIPTGITFYDIDFVGSEIYLTGDAFNLYKTADNGTTWQPVSHLDPSQPWTSTFYATDFFADKLVAVGAFGLINSKTGAGTPVTFTQLRKPGAIYDIWSHDQRIVTVGAPTSNTSYDQFMISTNGGTTWVLPVVNKTNPGQSHIAFVPPPSEEEALESKEELLVPNSTSTIRSIEMLSATDGFAVGSNGAVYKTTNGGLAWDSLATPTIPATAVLYKVDFVSPTTGWIFSNTGDVTGTIFKTTDGGLTWEKQILTGQTSTNSRIYGAHMVNESYGWIVNYEPRPFKTTDGGATWTIQTLSDAYTGFLYDVQMIDTLLGYCVGGSGRFYKTTDGGTAWNVLPTGVTATLYDVDFHNESYGVVSGSSGVMLLTTDGGTTFELANNTGAATNYAAFLKMPAGGSDTLSVLSAGSSGFIMRKSIFVVPVELSSLTASVSGTTVTINWMTATETNNLGFEIERSAQGSEWQKIGFINGVGTTTDVSKYSFNDGNLASGIYNYRIKQIDFDGSYKYYNLAEAVEISVPMVFELSQNYPNPFNPATTISFSLPFASEVSLKVYDVLGNEVASLLNSQKEAGRYEVQFDGSRYSSGVYFYELKAGNFVSVKKLMLLK